MGFRCVERERLEVTGLERERGREVLEFRGLEIENLKSRYWGLAV